MCEKEKERNLEVVSMEEYLEKRENKKKSDGKIDEKKTAIVKAVLEFAYLYM